MNPAILMLIMNLNRNRKPTSGSSDEPLTKSDVLVILSIVVIMLAFATLLFSK